MTDCESAGRNAGFLWRWLGLIFCFSLLLPGVVHADTPVRHSLAELIQGSQYAQISAQSPRLEIPWTVPKQQEADQALLHLFYFVSPGTAPGTELVVSLDGRDVGAVQESPKYPEGQAVIRLANHAIAAGGHEVEIQLKLAHPDAAKSNAWTQLDLYRSSLGYQAHHLPWQKVDFADFDDMLRDASQSGAWTLPLELDGAPTPQILTAAQQVVAGIALRAQAPVLVHVQQTTASGAGKTALQNSHAPMTVVIGTEEELSGSYGKLGQFNGPVMLLQRSAAGDGGVDLVITGPTPADVLQAARTFASNREAVPVGNVWQVPKSLAPTQAHFDRVQNPPALQPGMEVPIRSAHSQDVDGEILAGKMIHFSFWMPGGQFADRQAQMVMKLNLDVTPDKKNNAPPPDHDFGQWAMDLPVAPGSWCGPLRNPGALFHLGGRNEPHQPGDYWSHGQFVGGIDTAYSAYPRLCHASRSPPLRPYRFSTGADRWGEVESDLFRPIATGGERRPDSFCAARPGCQKQSARCHRTN